GGGGGCARDRTIAGGSLAWSAAAGGPAVADRRAVCVCESREPGKCEWRHGAVCNSAGRTAGERRDSGCAGRRCAGCEPGLAIVQLAADQLSSFAAQRGM